MYSDRVSRGDLHVPRDFVLGAATAAYQIEGGASEGGRGPSIWDTFTHTPGKIADGANGDVAADHYHHVEEDLDLMASLHLDAYRFSISWSRVVPTGDGPVNAVGLQFYSSLIDGLIARGIRPVVTLNHWDLPQALEDKYGGWRGRETAFAFERYAEIVGSALGDRVAIWSTHNEPWNSSYSGYGSGAFAPGGTSHADALRAVHHLNLGHGLAVKALRRTITRDGALVGVVLNIFRIEAETPADVEAARRLDAVANRAFTGPMLHGAYPEDLLQDTRHLTDWSFVQPGDLDNCRQPIDVLGVNYYEVMHVRLKAGVTPEQCSTGGTAFPGSEHIEIVRRAELERTAIDWGVEPRGLEELLLDLSREHPGLALMVMENGAAFDDVVIDEGEGFCVLDLDRARFLFEHVSATLRAKSRGAQVLGYFVWSLLDNFEWALGYTPRFGVVRVDYKTQDRIPKLSSHWLAELCRTRLVPTIA